MAESTQNINEIQNEIIHNHIPSYDILSANSKSESKSDGANEYINKGQKIYRIANYHFNCEEHNQIAFIIPLARTTPKFILFIILNICTIGIINFFVAWFPKLILYIYYSYTELPNATHLGIFNKIDQEFEVVEIKIIDLPPIDYDSPLSIVKRFNLNIEKYAKQITVFEYKLFNYIYSQAIDTFEAIYYRIKSPYHDIVENYSTGLNPNEVLFMKKIFGVCDIDIKINSCGKILFDELTDPFYLFQLYSIILWYCTQYYYYATVIVVLAILSLTLSTYGTYKNLKKIQEISRYSCTVRVYRKNENN
jgi:cation-transporting ATPase 13A3/4/5